MNTKEMINSVITGMSSFTSEFSSYGARIDEIGAKIYQIEEQINAIKKQTGFKEQDPDKFNGIDPETYYNSLPIEKKFHNNGEIVPYNMLTRDEQRMVEYASETEVITKTPERDIAKLRNEITLLEIDLKDAQNDKDKTMQKALNKLNAEIRLMEAKQRQFDITADTLDAEYQRDLITGNHSNLAELNKKAKDYRLNADVFRFVTGATRSIYAAMNNVYTSCFDLSGKMILDRYKDVNGLNMSTIVGDIADEEIAIIKNFESLLSAFQSVKKNYDAEKAKIEAIEQAVINFDNKYKDKSGSQLVSGFVSNMKEALANINGAYKLRSENPNVEMEEEKAPVTAGEIETKVVEEPAPAVEEPTPVVEESAPVVEEPTPEVPEVQEPTEEVAEERPVEETPEVQEETQEETQEEVEETQVEQTAPVQVVERDSYYRVLESRSAENNKWLTATAASLGVAGVSAGIPVAQAVAAGVALGISTAPVAFGIASLAAGVAAVGAATLFTRYTIETVQRGIYNRKLEAIASKCNQKQNSDNPEEVWNVKVDINKEMDTVKFVVIQSDGQPRDLTSEDVEALKASGICDIQQELNEVFNNSRRQAKGWQTINPTNLDIAYAHIGGVCGKIAREARRKKLGAGLIDATRKTADFFRETGEKLSGEEELALGTETPDAPMIDEGTQTPEAPAAQEAVTAPESAPAAVQEIENFNLNIQPVSPEQLAAYSEYMKLNEVYTEEMKAEMADAYNLLMANLGVDENSDEFEKLSIEVQDFINLYEEKVLNSRTR